MSEEEPAGGPHVRTTLDEARKLIFIRLRTGVTVDDVLEAYRAVLADPRFEAGMSVVWDLSRLDLTRHPVTDIRRIAAELRTHAEERGDGYRAALYTSRTVDYHLLRVYLGILKLLGHAVIRVFDDEDAAATWAVSG